MRGIRVERARRDRACAREAVQADEPVIVDVVTDIEPRAPGAMARLDGKGSGDDAEFANSFEQRLIWRGRRPKVRDIQSWWKALAGYSGYWARKVSAVRAASPGRPARAGRRREDRSSAVARVALERLVEQVDGCFGARLSSSSAKPPKKNQMLWRRSAGSSAMARSIAGRVSPAP